MHRTLTLPVDLAVLRERIDEVLPCLLDNTSSRTKNQFDQEAFLFCPTRLFAAHDSRWQVKQGEASRPERPGSLGEHQPLAKADRPAYSPGAVWRVRLIDKRC